KPTYWMAQDLYESAIKEVDAVINRWLLSTEDLSEYETEKLIYERLMYGCTYLEEGPHTGTAYGALVLGQARCEGYSQALNLTLRRAGIDSLILTGEARTPATESSPEKVERHSWNAAKIGGSYYQLDATWDDPDDDNDELPIGSAYAYFNVTDAEMYKNRTLDQIFHTTIIPPACNDKTYNYFAMTDTYIPAGTRVQEALYSLLDRAVENGDTTSITGKLETDDQYETISENLRDWMHEWYKEKKYSSGTYNWAVYPDSRVFLITNLVYEK
ncbi:hypothetical protein LJC42_08440, partial [Eubacteriales bacterium OttesenSCG-928-K08]|nr:hypothetical protein [Eubacteriales bacterium OttesenSCG-928-K08]